MSFFMDVSAMPLWQWFVVIGLLLTTAEMFVPGFVVLPIGVGFFAAAVVAFFVISPVVIYLALAVCLLLSWWLCGKFLKPKPSQNRYRSNVERLIGQSCTVIEAIGERRPGRIKILGDVFFALLEDHQQGIAAGAEVVILRFDGNKAIVAVK